MDSDMKEIFNKALAKAQFEMENTLYNGLIAEHAGEMDVEGYMQLTALISAFNRRGVSTKIVFDAIKEAFAKEGGTDE